MPASAQANHSAEKAGREPRKPITTTGGTGLSPPVEEAATWVAAPGRIWVVVGGILRTSFQVKESQ